MKKTLTVNVSGVVFSIDEDAYKMLECYLSDIEGRLNAVNEDSETIRDIESRIMEIFKENEKGSFFVVNIELVKRVIAIIGAPSVFGDKEQEYCNTSKKGRLMRNPNNKIFGGVCSGLSSYFKIDLTAMRIVLAITAILFFGTLLVAYIILWIVIPEAQTKEDIDRLNREQPRR